MKIPSLFFSCLLVLQGPVGAQDLEPSLSRAAAHLVSELARELPALDPPPEALALIPAPGLPPALLGSLASALTAAGYRVFLGAFEEAGLRFLKLKVSGQLRPGGGQLDLEAVTRSARRWTCGFLNASWVDEPEAGSIQEVGPFQSSRASAREAVFERAWLRLRTRAGLEGNLKTGRALLERLPRRFVMSWGQAPDGTRVYRAYLRLLPDGGLLRGFRKAQRSRRRFLMLEPWLRAGASVILALLLAFGYLYLDLRTKGYLSTPLRLLFGILFLIEVLVCWRVTL